MLTNPVIIAVVVMCVLCLLRVNVLLSILASAIVAGLMAGMPIDETMSTLFNNMGGQSETALSYILLGTLAVAIYQTGLATLLSNKLERFVGKMNSRIFLVIIAVIACFSQNLVPIHIAFIPIMIPPLLGLMNEMKIDRRAAACALTFGLKAPYIALPIGFGKIFHGIIKTNLIENGMPIEGNLTMYMLVPAGGMLLGLLIAIFFSYRKPREYKNLPINIDQNDEIQMVSDRFTTQHLGATLGVVACFVIQLMDWGSLPLGAFTGLAIMIAFGAVPFKQMENTMAGGIKLMGYIAFVMLVASGFGGVIRATGGVTEIVDAAASAVGNNKLVAAVILLIIGLFITLGIGTSFGTVPIVATIYVPLCAALGFSPASTAILLGVAGALGDAGSPASDSTLGPTSGLNADGQHDHIWDTCVPTFLHYNIPLIIFGAIGAMIF